jgi:tetratricopeptide (TPR) repeat protein
MHCGMSRPQPLCERASRSPSRTVWGVLLILAAVFLLQGSLRADELEDAKKLFLKGEYSECLRLCESATTNRYPKEEWFLLLSDSLLTVGRYADAQTAISRGMTRHSSSIRVRMAAYEVFQQNGDAEKAKSVLEEINTLGSSRRWAYQDTPNIVALGQAAMLLGADARLVLENFFNQAKKSDPDYRDVYLAIGQLALDKSDSDLAAQTFQEAVKRFKDDPEMHYGLARAFSSGDRTKMGEHLEAALKHNEKHLPSLLLLADHLIDAEEYQDAEKNLEKVVSVNPSHPEAWAYRAVLAHLDNDPDKEKQAREKALAVWKNNPRVAHLIGQKLSQKYRFAEGAAFQREALRGSKDYWPAKNQLAQDLLRLGEDAEGWRLAEEVHEHDGYDVVAYNLATLHETMSKFQILTNQDFIVRMHSKEAAVYGERVLALLQRAKDTLCRKYGLTLDRPTIVEIFPEQKDFAVRTFGMPGGEGFLGVCFGRVITANSPASQAANPSNWEAVLWHEFCHVVTLGLTKNKMPRWLSEGISVYEELQANPSWGQEMLPKYRDMIVKGELSSVAELSSAFLTPKTPLHLQFAYYESALVVEYLVQNFGIDALKQILVDLGKGKPINPTIEAHTASMDKIEKAFREFVRQRAEELGPGLDWKQPEPGDLTRAAAGDGNESSRNYYLLTQRAKKLLDDKKWEEAKVPLRVLIEHCPTYSGSDNAYALMAAAHRGLKETEQERAMLSKLAALDADATDAYLRLMELDSTTQEWSAVAANAERFIAVNPLVSQPHRYLARASEELGKPQPAIKAYQTLLRLDPTDPAEIHFRLAKLLHNAGDASAKRHVLEALEEAPRFREAYPILLKIAGQEAVSEKNADNPRTLPVPAIKP